MLLSRFDGWLVDRVAQPASERLSRFGTCFDLARLCGAGIYVLNAGSAAAGHHAGWLDLFLDILACGVPVVVAYQYLGTIKMVERLLSRHIANPIRHEPVMQGWRIFYSLLNLSAGATMLVRHSLEPGTSLFAVACLLWTPMLYLSACTPRPPSPAAREPFPAASVPQGA